MKNNTDVLKQEYEKQFSRNESFIKSNNWVSDRSFSETYDTERDIINNMLKSFSSFLEEVEEDRYLKPIIKFTEKFISIVNIHLSRIEEFLDSNEQFKVISSQIENAELLDDEKKRDSKISLLHKKKKDLVKFQNELFTQRVSVKTRLSKMDLLSTNISGISPNLYYGDMKASLLMRPILEKSDKYVKTRTEGLDIDFTAAHINPATSNQMLINMKPGDIPKYDKNKHFFEQEKSVIEFWQEEFIKNTKGVTIGGYFIHPFLYWHLNTFKFTIGSGLNKRVDHPVFWDNDYYFVELLKEAEARGNCGIFSYGSRRTSKTTKMTSFTQWKLHTVPYAEGSLIGFSDKDLKEIWKYTQVNISNMHPAFSVELLANTMDDGIKLGIRSKNASFVHKFAGCEVSNLDSGSKAGNLKTAGGTPDFLAIDEAAKGPVLKAWEAALASFAAADSDKWRTVPLLSATAGEEELSKDAEKMLQNPEEFHILPMNWDLYDEHVPEEHVTWDKEDFGHFVPAQMSLEAPIKKKTNMSLFLGEPDNKELSKVKISVTDWEKASDYFKERQNKLIKVPERLAGEKKNFPLSISDCLISTDYNRFPSLEAKRHKSSIESSGDFGRFVELYKDTNGIIKTALSSKDIVREYPFKGGNHDAPVVLFDELEEGVTPKFGLYVIGLDDIKHNKSDGDSLFSVSMYKRKYDGGKFADRFAGYYHTRPYRKEDAYKQTYLLMKMYNAIVFPEDQDEGFVEYVERNHIGDLRHIADGVNFASINNLHKNKNRSYGCSTDRRNIEYLNRKLEFYSKRDDFIVEGQDGIMGVQTIGDIMLLEELSRYKVNKNADRIRSASLAYAYGDFLDKYNIHVYASDYMTANKNKSKKDKELDFGYWDDLSGLQVW